MIKHTGTTTLETERLILRKFTVEDAQFMFKNWASDEEVTKHLTWKPHSSLNLTKEIILTWCEKYAESTFYHWAIVLKETLEPIGSITVVGQSDCHERCEVGYCIGKAYWNKGITTEAFRAVNTFLFENVGFFRIEATHFTENPASGKVMMKAGMEYEGIRRGYVKNSEGVFMDCASYGLLKTDMK